MIGIYAHHAGGGHAVRSAQVATQLSRGGHAVTILGSALPRQITHGDLGPSVSHIVLARDDGAGQTREPDAHGQLHWAPLGNDGLRSRLAALARWVDVHAPSVLVVDVSVEVALFARLMGVPVVLVAQPGSRADQPHQTAYAIADAIIAPWPASVDPAPDLRAHADRVHHVGGISRFDNIVGMPARKDRGMAGLVLSGRDGFADPALPQRLRAACPDIEWELAGGRFSGAEVADRLLGSDVVVTHAGQNAVADVAAIDRPTVVVPEERPHLEQVHLARALAQEGFAVAAPAGADPNGVDWRAMVDDAMRLRSRWADWQTAGAAARAASVVKAVANGALNRGRARGFGAL